MDKELHRFEGKEGFFTINKVKVMYEVKEFSTFCTFTNIDKKRTEVKRFEQQQNKN